jgi:Txe/YoeB family toxin of Txe-Axe toxin-antitoxin module
MIKRIKNLINEILFARKRYTILEVKYNNLQKRYNELWSQNINDFATFMNINNH